MDSSCAWDRVSTPSARAESHGLAVVLVHPEIPPNTGNIGRLCAATRTPLHLVEPLGFSLEDRYLRRAGLDYWPHLRLTTHASWEGYRGSAVSRRRIYLSARGETSYLIAPLAGDDELDLVFGCETKGLPPEVIAEDAAAVYRIPIANPAVRSLNLANAVAIVLYEALRQRSGSENSPGS